MKNPRKTPGAASRRRFLATVAAGAAGGAAAATLLPAVGAAAPAGPKRRPVTVAVHPQAVPRTNSSRGPASHGE